MASLWILLVSYCSRSIFRLQCNAQYVAALLAMSCDTPPLYCALPWLEAFSLIVRTREILLPKWVVYILAKLSTKPLQFNNRGKWAVTDKIPTALCLPAPLLHYQLPLFALSSSCSRLIVPSSHPLLSGLPSWLHTYVLQESDTLANTNSKCLWCGVVLSTYLQACHISYCILSPISKETLAVSFAGLFRW